MVTTGRELLGHMIRRSYSYRYSQLSQRSQVDRSKVNQWEFYLYVHGTSSYVHVYLTLLSVVVVTCQLCALVYITTHNCSFILLDIARCQVQKCRLGLEGDSSLYQKSSYSDRTHDLTRFSQQTGAFYLSAVLERKVIHRVTLCPHLRRHVFILRGKNYYSHAFL